MTSDTPSIDGWTYGRVDDASWIEPPGGDHRVRLIGTAGGIHLALFEASAGYQAPAHRHVHPELLFVMSGVVETNGVRLGPADGYAAAADSWHDSFVVIEPAAYLAAFHL